MKTIILLGLFFLWIIRQNGSTEIDTASLQQKCTEKAFDNHPMNNQYKKLLTEYQLSNQLPGAVIAIQQQSESLWIGAVGSSDMDRKIPMQTCTPFRIGSITKVFIAAVVLQLHEEGKLKLEDKLMDYLPIIKDKIPQAELITIRMLLNHTSGIADPKNDDPVYLQQITTYPEQMDSMSIDERLEQYVYGRSLHFTPGTESRYSNTGYWLAGKIIEKITGKNMQQALDSRIFQPLQMTNTYYEERENNKVSAGYFLVKDTLTNVTKWDKADGDGDPSSGIISTAEDLWKFGKALLEGKIINRRSLHQMLRTTSLPACPDSVCEYGLGIETWNIGSFKGYGKNGSSIGYETNWIYIPEKKTMVITFANKGGGSDKNFIHRILTKTTDD